MLVLSRKVGERLLIGEGVVLTVLGIRGKQVRLGLAAPETVSILREEVSTATRPSEKSPRVGTQPVRRSRDSLGSQSSRPSVGSIPGEE